MANFGEGDVLVVNGLRYYQGGTVLGDLTITGDLAVQGGGSLAYDEIVTGTLEVTTSVSSPIVSSIAGALTVTGITTSGVVVQTGDTNNYVSVGNGILRLGTAGTQRMTVQAGQLSIEQAMPIIFYTGAQTGETSRFIVAAGSTTWAGAAATTLAITVGSGASVIKIGTTANASANGNILVGNGTTWYHEYTTSGFTVNGGVNGGIWNLNGTGEMLSVDVATSGATLKDSPRYTMRGRYWDGAASQNYDAYFYHDLTATSPTSRLVCNIGGNDRLYLTSAGAMSVDSVAALTTNAHFSIGYNGTGGISMGAPTGATGEIRIGPSDQDRYDVVATYHNWRVGNIQAMNLTSGLLRLDTLTDLGFYTDSGTTLTGKFVNVATSLTWQGPDTTDSLLVQNGSMVLTMNSVNVRTLADAYWVQRMMGNGVSVDNHLDAVDLVITNGVTIAANDIVVWDAAVPGRVKKATATGDQPIGPCLVGGTGDVTGTVKATIAIRGYVASLTADTGGVTQFQYIEPGGGAPGTKWNSQATIERSCGIALETAAENVTFHAWLFGPH